jgi:hypothetical protein
MNKTINLSTLKKDKYYLLVQKYEGLSIKVQYIGCTIAKYTTEIDDFFDEEINQLVEPIQYTNGPCTDLTPHIYGFRDSYEQIYNIVDGNIPGISNIHKYQIYQYPEWITTVSDDEEIKCNWERNDELRYAFFKFLMAQTEKAWASDIKYNGISIPDAVKTGILTSKIKGVSNGYPILSITEDEAPNIIEFIRRWYQLTQSISGQIFIEDQPYWCIYRVVYDVDMLLNNTIIQPLPFSNTYNLEWVKREWLGDNKCCLLKINIPLHTNMLVIEPPDQVIYQGRKSQYEITLPAGIMRKTNIIQDKNGLIVTTYDFEPWTFEQCQEYILSHLNRDREEDDEEGGFRRKRQRLGFSNVIIDEQIMPIQKAVQFLSVIKPLV